jgi:hypothetical protein
MMGMDIQSLGESAVGEFTGMVEVWFGIIVETPTGEGLFICSGVFIVVSVKFWVVEIASFVGRMRDSIIVGKVGVLTF